MPHVEVTLRQVARRFGCILLKTITNYNGVSTELGRRRTIQGAVNIRLPPFGNTAVYGCRIYAIALFLMYSAQLY